MRDLIRATRRRASLNGILLRYKNDYRRFDPTSADSSGHASSSYGDIDTPIGSVVIDADGHVQTSTTSSVTEKPRIDSLRYYLLYQTWLPHRDFDSAYTCVHHERKLSSPVSNTRLRTYVDCLQSAMAKVIYVNSLT